MQAVGQGYYNPCPLGGDDCLVSRGQSHTEGRLMTAESMQTHALLHRNTLGLDEVSSEEEVVASIAELQLQKFTTLKNQLHATCFSCLCSLGPRRSVIGDYRALRTRLVCYAFVRAPGGRVKYLLTMT